MNDAINQLRKARDAYLKDYDNIVMRSMCTGVALPQDVLTYLQELRDLPKNVTPLLGENGLLDEDSFQWPVKPLNQFK